MRTESENCLAQKMVPGAGLSVKCVVYRGALGYCFVELTDEATAERCLRKVNGKSLPGANPVSTFILKINLYLIISFARHHKKEHNVFGRSFLISHSPQDSS